MKPTKPGVFRQDSFDQNDKWGIDIIKAHLSDKNYITHDGEKYKIDIIAFEFGSSQPSYFEVETKDTYFTSADDWKFDTVSFLQRKKKHEKEAEKAGGFWYVIVSKKTNYAVACHSKVIFQEENIEKFTADTKQRKGTDVRYGVDPKKCIFFKLDHWTKQN